MKAKRSQAVRDREAANREARCLRCSTLFTPSHGNQGLCSDECREARMVEANQESLDRRRRDDPERIAQQRRERSRRYRDRNPPPAQYGECGRCGQTFEKPHGNAGYCSDECRRDHKQDYNARYWQENKDQLTDYYRAFKAEHQDRYREYSRQTANRRRSILAEVEYEDIDRQSIFDRDGWVCQICREPVDPNVAWPDTRSASLDHVVPVSEGGGHIAANVQLAHYGCNAGKQARTIPDGEQLRIIG